MFKRWGPKANTRTYSEVVEQQNENVQPMAGQKRINPGVPSPRKRINSNQAAIINTNGSIIKGTQTLAVQPRHNGAVTTSTNPSPRIGHICNSYQPNKTNSHNKTMFAYNAKAINSSNTTRSTTDPQPQMVNQVKIISF